jgi:hypothetical protein
LQIGARGGLRHHHFVTYSEHVKYQTLVERYQVSSSAIAAVPHGANRLDDLITVSGFPDNEASTDAFCTNLFRGALYKAIGTQQASNFDSGDVEFIFYASQFRPSKNVMTLLRAYELAKVLLIPLGLPLAVVAFVAGGMRLLEPWRRTKKLEAEQAAREAERMARHTTGNFVSYGTPSREVLQIAKDFA